ncbi:ATP-dependent DNA helicase RecG [Candidatus Margulisiibacteriota bacterium]
MPLDTEVRYLKGVGPKLAKTLSRVGVFTLKDLIYYFPREYEDRNDVRPISSLKPGEEALLQGEVVSLTKQKTKRNFVIIKGVIKDASGSIKVIWFNQPFLLNVLKKGTELFLKGKLDYNSYSGETLFVPRYYEIKDAKDPLPVVPIYPLTEGLFQKKMRSIIQLALKECLYKIEDPLPQSIKDNYKLASLKSSIAKLHYPKAVKEVEPAKKRLVFDEFFLFHIGILMRKKALKENLPGIAFQAGGEIVEKFIGSLPFTLTNSQKKVISEIEADMVEAPAMNRLLQGDVGSGKTIVAVYAMLTAIQNGYQVAIMAPTEILANQHYYKIQEFLEGLDVPVRILTGSGDAKARQKVHKEISTGKPLIVVGTHALIEEKVKFEKLGLIVVDEQHRFGVLQRGKLKSKGKNPDVLFMTATPIPRSLALTAYGDLDSSVITEMPPGRTETITRFVDEKEQGAMYGFIRKEIDAGRQVYIVYPLVEESAKIDLKAVKTEHLKLKKTFNELEVGLIHGRMKGEEKNAVMKRFKAGEIDILVSTTVIEVGIDIPNATIMVIEHAERFGLSQLHQLRGRIGRGSERSYCFLVANPKSEAARSRVKAMLDSNDGFYIAEVDLKIRGPGELLGIRQSGLSFPGCLLNFRVADIIHEEEMLGTTRSAAVQLVAEDPFLNKAENKPLKQEILSKYGEFLEIGALN